ncbi:hypothetical protein NC653_040547 [Populus alba x Populus x berolinensis]|uniref:Uncharacterized protein n=1 Tax=Populus alba x Populus x berolinensis TaxID=444605 RepID=A0AAD6L6E7_9ROSI|nr:hypothetical protein NC653_040547 [Populus alba x Populus x berolinensis]
MANIKSDLILDLNNVNEDIANVSYTGHQFYIHSPCNRHCTFILAVSSGDQQFIIAFSTIFPYLQFYRHGGDHEGDWIFIDYAIEWKLCTRIEHAAVFKDKVYVVTARFSTSSKNAGSTWRRSSPWLLVPGFIEFSCFRRTIFFHGSMYETTFTN